MKHSLLWSPERKLRLHKWLKMIVTRSNMCLFVVGTDCGVRPGGGRAGADRSGQERRLRRVADLVQRAHGAVHGAHRVARSGPAAAQHARQSQQSRVRQDGLPCGRTALIQTLNLGSFRRIGEDLSIDWNWMGGGEIYFNHANRRQVYAE